MSQSSNRFAGFQCSMFNAQCSMHTPANYPPTHHSPTCHNMPSSRHAVLDRGINLLDTAPWYGHGISEIVVGYALDTILSDDRDGFDPPEPERRPRNGSLPRSDLIVQTKIGRYESDPSNQFDFSHETTLRSVRRSLRRMNCGYIDVLQLHDPEFLLGMPAASAETGMEILMTETIPALLECKRRGWARGLGITGYPLEVQHEILIRCRKHFGRNNGNDVNDGDDDNGMAVVFDQSLVYCHCNLHDMSLFLDRSFSIVSDKRTLHGDDISSSDDDGENTMTTTTTTTTTTKVSFAQFCKRTDVNLMCAAPLSMGLLTLSGPPSWHPASPSLKEACVEASQLCQRSDDDISSLAVLFALSQREVGCTLIGMKNKKEVDAAADLAGRFRDVDFDDDDDDDNDDDDDDDDDDGGSSSFPSSTDGNGEMC
ncbi:hypothetical protein ACHAXS_000809, partial [Conticribra weissflogii]